MKVGIAGAGAIAMGYAAFLLENGHTPALWSPSGKRTASLLENEPLAVTGAIEGRFSPQVCKSAEALAENDVIILALPAYGHRLVLDSLAPFLEARHCVIISGHLSFAALYLSKKLAERSVQIPIAVWNTTALTAKAPTSYTKVRIGKIRSKIDMVVIPERLTQQAADICRNLFGDPFRFADDLLDIALANLNPQAHLGIAMCNLTRIEHGEDWLQNTNTTPTVCNLIEALDRERLEIAKGFGKSIPSMGEKMEQALGVSNKTFADLHLIEIEQGINPPGPKDIDTRYVLEDAPFGLAPTLLLADLASVAAPLHEAGLQIMNACYKRNFAADNDLLPELGPLSLGTLKDLSVNGYS